MQRHRRDLGISSCSIVVYRVGRQLLDSVYIHASAYIRMVAFRECDQIQNKQPTSHALSERMRTRPVQKPDPSDPVLDHRSHRDIGRKNYINVYPNRGGRLKSRLFAAESDR